MTYDEVQVGQQVRIETRDYVETGVVKRKEVLNIGGKEVERVYIDTNRKGGAAGRRLCAPSVLEPADG